MPRLKNALRGHFVADINETDPTTEPIEWLELAKYISTAEPADNEETEDEGFYDGDGTPETSVTSIAIGWTFEGYRDRDDEAQNLIVSKRLTPNDRDVWHKVASADGKSEMIGIATASEISDGGGEATAYETFAATLTYKSIPTVIEPVVVPDA